MKRLALLATGGTIACRETAEGLSPALHAKELLQEIHHRADTEFCCRDVFSMDSSNIQPEEWTALARACDEGMIERFEGDYLSGAVSLLEKL